MSTIAHVMLWEEGLSIYRVVQKVFVTFDFLLYISYKTTFVQNNILKLSLGRFLLNLFQDTQNSLNFICLFNNLFFFCMVFAY